MLSKRLRYAPYADAKKSKHLAINNLLYFYEIANNLPIGEVYFSDIDCVLRCKKCKNSVVRLEFSTQVDRPPYACHSTIKEAFIHTVAGVPNAALLVIFSESDLIETPPAWGKGGNILIPCSVIVKPLYYPFYNPTKGCTVITTQEMFNVFPQPFTAKSFLLFLEDLKKSIHPQVVCENLQRGVYIQNHIFLQSHIPSFDEFVNKVMLKYNVGRCS